MPRQNRRRDAEGSPTPPSVTGQRVEAWRGRDHVVRSVTGSGASKAYRCPGCDQLINPGWSHVVCWPADDPDADDRRHWHTPCWAARDTRTVSRTRSAPRF